MPPFHLILANNQFFFLKLGIALSVMAEAHGYPGAPTRACYGDFEVGFS